MVWSQRHHVLPLPCRPHARLLHPPNKEPGQIPIAPHIDHLPPDAGDTFGQTSAAAQPGDADQETTYNIPAS